MLVPGVVSGASGAGSGAFAAGALAGGILAAGTLTAGLVVLSVGSVVVEPAGSPVVSVVPAAVSVPGGASTRVADGSDELKTEHAASSGIMASTSSTRIKPPLTQPASTCATGTSRARTRTVNADGT